MEFDAGLLDEFSGAFAQALFAVHPEWKAFARVDIAEDGETPELVVEVPAPQRGKDIPKLFVYTDDSEVTVSFGWYHCHFDWPAADADPSINPLAFIAEILNEDVAVVSGWSDGKWSGSWTVTREEQVVVPPGISRVDTIRVRSWKGTLNQDISTPGS